MNLIIIIANIHRQRKTIELILFIFFFLPNLYGYHRVLIRYAFHSCFSCHTSSHQSCHVYFEVLLSVYLSVSRTSRKQHLNFVSTKSFEKEAELAISQQGKKSVLELIRESNGKSFDKEIIIHLNKHSRE